MGMAAIGIALYKYVMKYSPKNCDYFNRDRFVLSNGMRSVFSRQSKPVIELNLDRPCLPLAIFVYAPCGCEDHDT